MAEVKKALPETRTVMGGIHATFAAEDILREFPFVDYIVKGEAEHAFPKLLDHLEAGTKASDVEGISFMDDGRHIINPLSIIQDLDSLPMPARELTRDVEYGYSHKGIPLTFGKFTTVSTSRGCPFHCSYCSCSAFSLRKWRARSAEKVVDELESLYSQGYETCVFVDDNFTHSRRRVESICELIRQRRIRLRMYCEGRADSASYETMRTMHRAGFDVIYFGVESASPKVLRYYRKTVKPPKAAEAISNAKRSGMVVVTSFIFGAPDETEDEMRMTMEFIRRNRPHAVQINILDCLIGTPIWDDLVAKGLVGPDDWKRNHRIWEYTNNGFDRARLESLANEGYAAYIESWKTWRLIPEILWLLGTNRSARKIVFGNLLNPAVRRRISEGMAKGPETNA